MRRLQRPASFNEATISEVTQRLRLFLRGRYRAIAYEHEDLIQETLADVVDYLGSRKDNIKAAETVPLALTILKRRVADNYRKAVRDIAHAAAELDSADPGSHDSEEKYRYRNALRSVMQLMTELDAKDRELLLRKELQITNERPLADSERKRLSRLRQKLRARLRERLGAEVEEYLAG